MNKLSTVFFLLLVIAVKAQNSNYQYKFTYKVKSKLDLKNENRQANENMSLYVGTDRSLYISDVFFKIDSARNSIKLRRGNSYELSELKQTLPKNLLKNSIKKNLTTRTYEYVYGEIPVQYIFYIDNLPVFNWKIQTEEKSILGYICQKAILNYKGRDYIAWFSSEIPIQNGPWKFGGLPGLIFEISDTKDDYRFTLIGIKKDSKPFPKIKQKIIKTEKENLENTIENIYRSFENMLTHESKIRARRNRIEKQKKRKPNPIELEK